MHESRSQPPDALLLTAQGCSYCAGMKTILNKLYGEGLLKRFEEVDVAEHPEIAARYGVRSVPWLALGPFHLQGMHSETDIRTWLKRLDTDDATQEYYRQLLLDGDLDQVMAMMGNDPAGLFDLLALAAAPDLDLKLRLGISAVFEAFEGKPELQALSCEFIKLASHDQASVRADAAHYLSLTHDRAVVAVLRTLAADPDREVREVAEDALAELDDDR